ncbi:MAG TPA: YedE family putative selenium transporter [Haloplasmataceae bacterium]
MKKILSNTKLMLLFAGLACGLIAMTLAIFGNPGNMAICIACFIRDIAGAIKLHSAGVVQYVRPEIIGMILGALILSIGTKEYRAQAGSSPLVRFLLGMMMMIGALVFLGCPLRMIIRMSAGDLNAYIALIGFVAGVATGVLMLKRGYTLGKAHETNYMNGFVIPFLLVFILVLSLTTTLLAQSTSGPGSLFAPVTVSLIAGLLFGAIAQRSRMCFAGSIRDAILVKNFNLLIIIGGLFVVMLIYNIASGNFHFALDGQPISHSDHLWNILGMYVVGFAAVLAGGCPLRQLILTGQGSSDAGVTVLGMFAGAAFSHNFGLASVANKGATDNGKIAVLICIALLFIIGFFNKRKGE